MITAYSKKKKSVNMKKNLLSIIIIFVSISLAAQEANDYYNDEFPELENTKFNNEIFNKKLPLLDKNRFSFRFSTGFSAMNFAGNGIFSTYTMPEFNYRVTNRFSLSAGILTSVSYIPSFSRNAENQYPMNSKMYNYAVYLKGEYQTTDRLTLYGTVFYVPSSVFNTDFTATSFGFDYKIAEKVTFSAGININKGHNFYAPYFNPSYGYGFNSGYGNIFKHY